MMWDMIYDYYLYILMFTFKKYKKLLHPITACKRHNPAVPKLRDNTELRAPAVQPLTIIKQIK